MGVGISHVGSPLIEHSSFRPPQRAMLSSCGPATSSCNVSPRHAVAPTATRRRGAEPADRLFDEEEDNATISVHHHSHIHRHHHQYQPVRYLVLRRKLLPSVPEPVLRWIEDVMQWWAGAAEGIRARRNVGRKTLGLLIVMVVVSLFVRISFLSSYIDVRGLRFENDLLRLHNFKDDWAQAQRVVAENDEACMPKHLHGKLATPEIWMKPNSENYYQCIARPKNRISQLIPWNGLANKWLSLSAC